jgi:ferritin
MIKDKIQQEINKQINEEFFSAYLYLSMAAHFKSVNLNGFANWMYIQYQEEIEHGMKFFNYLDERGGKVELEAIEKPQIDWESPLAAFEAAYKHEQHITDRINSMMELAIEEHDHATQSFLKWYVDEQVEEEASTEEIVEKLRLIGESKNGLFMLDRELGQRSPGEEEE